MSEKQRVIFILLACTLTFFFYFFYDDLSLYTQNLASKGLSETFRSANEEQSLEEDVKETTRVIVKEEDAVIDVVENSRDAVVSIVRSGVTFDFFDGPQRFESSIGTGFIIDGDEWIVLTNKHVVSDQGDYSVVIGDDEERYEVEKIYRDPINDFAILKIQKGNFATKDLPELSLGNSSDLKVGQTVVAIGNALGEFGNSVTKGVVSGLSRGITAQSGIFGAPEYLEDVIQTDAALNPGNSGGPLLNLSGEVVGINVAISQGADNIGFSIPIDTLKPVINSFLESGTIARPFLGVEYISITKDVSERRAIPVGAFIRDVVDGSPADNAGIRAGDIILRIDGIRLNDSNNSLSKVIAKTEIGKEIEILIDRNGREIELNLRLIDLSEEEFTE